MRALFGLLLSTPALAAAPLQLAHQGRLFDAAGAPIDGTVALRVTLYDTEAQADPGLWTREFTGVPVSDGYFAVSLVTDDGGQPLDPADFEDGEVWVGVATAAGALGPRQRLGSVPYAISAGSGTATVPLVAGASGPCTPGAMIYDTTFAELRVCTTGTWSREIVQDGTFRRWSDGSFGASCEDYKRPSGGATGATSSGVYRIEPAGMAPFDVWCEMDLQGGGWTLALNLDTNDAATRDWSDTTFWTGASPVGSVQTPFANDHKSGAFDGVPAAELMIVAHVEGNSTYGSATYDFLPAFSGQTLRAHFNNRDNQTVTGPRDGSLGSVGTFGRARNGGDPFIDHPDAVIINSTYSPVDSTNLTRIGTNYGARCGAINCNGHNFGGIGGRHSRSTWGAYYEAAALNGYCSTQGGYGSNGRAYNGNNAFDGNSDGCGASTTILADVDLAIYVR